MSESGALGEAGEHVVGGEVLGGEVSCAAAVTVVVALDDVDGGHDVVGGGEREEAFPGWQYVTEAGLLGDDGATGG